MSRDAALVFLAGILFVGMSYQPLWPTDLWDHVTYGRYILESGTIPTAEPLIELTESAGMVDIAWGSQVLMAWLASSESLGIAALQTLAGFLIAASCGTVAWTVANRSKFLAPGVIAAGVLLIVNWQQFRVFRPQSIGCLFFAVLLFALTRRLVGRLPARISVAVMFVVWANMHGSFAVGLTLLGTFCIGHYADAFWRTRSLRRALTSVRAQTMVRLIFLCVAATLINPNGYRIYPEVLQVGRHPNITSMYEWGALSLSSRQGMAMLSACLMLATLRFFSGARIRTDLLISLGLFVSLTVWSSRMINWSSPIIAVCIGVQSAALLRRLSRNREVRSHDRLTGKLSTQRRLVSAALLICLFATPLGRQLVMGRKADPKDSLSLVTPVKLSQFLPSLNEDISDGITFVPAEWSGFFRHKVPTLRPMVNLHVHLIPPDVWNDYLRLAFGSDQTDKLLTKYNIRLVVTDRRRNGPLIQFMRTASDFEQVYVDAQSRVFRRRN